MIMIKKFNQLIIKEDLKEFVTKQDLSKEINKVLNAVDGLVKKMDKLAHDRMQKQIDKLELKATN